MVETDDEPVLTDVSLEVPYVPDFLLEDVRLWFVPSRASANAVYHELTGKSAENWGSYYSKKGRSFLERPPREAEGPYSLDRDTAHIRILEPGRIFSPRPQLRLDPQRDAVPIVSLEKRRPLNPWKPNYIQALNFIKRYEWPQPVPRAVHYAVWDIEECGQIAGSTSWMNARAILLDNDSSELRATLADLFYNRPEDYPLGSIVYLDVLGRSGPAGFGDLCELATHPVSRKRKVVATTLGKLANPEGRDTLFALLDDEEPEVRRHALRAIGQTGLASCEGEAAERLRAYLESPEMPERVWAAQALLRGGDEEQRQYLIGLVKEEPRLLTDMGELGDVLADLDLEEAVPYLINRLKMDKPEFRADAAEALEKVMGVDLHYQSLDTSEQRRNAIRTCTRWWEERKRDRRRARD